MPSVRTRVAYERVNLALVEAQAKSVMADVPPVTIIADYTGTVLDGQLPLNIAIQRLDDETDVTTSADWSATTLSGDVTYTIGAATGIVNITDIGSSAVIEATSEYNGVARSRKIPVNLQLQDPPQSSGAGSESVYDSSIQPTASTSYGTANAGPLTLTCGASGEVSLTAPLSTITGSSTPGAYGCAGKWQYRESGDPTWIDADTEIPGTDTTLLPNGITQPGAIAVNQAVSSLTPSTDYEFQLLLRNTDTTDTIYYYGSATATTE